MAAVALRAGRLITRSPNSGFGTGSAPGPERADAHHQRAGEPEPPRDPGRVADRRRARPPARAHLQRQGWPAAAVPNPTRDMSAG